MSLAEMTMMQDFQWTPQPRAEQWVRKILGEFLDRCPEAAELSRRMTADTGTRFYDWVDTIFINDSTDNRRQLADAGFEACHTTPHVFVQNQGMFARIALHRRDAIVVHLKVTRVADFAAAWSIQRSIEGQEWLYRCVLAWEGDRAELFVGERWGWARTDLPADDFEASVTAERWLETFRARRRDFDNDTDGMANTASMLDRCPLPVAQKCALFFEAEREYWERRNRAARVQKARQDQLGLGWGNHDHHTYRSSRDHFAALVQLWEKLGLVCRERFYAGREAGWGAQVMEQPVAGIITFNDVDLTPDELIGDFSHDGLSSDGDTDRKLGTVGLWCALHGEAVLQAGMHHLEAQFDFNSLRDQLASADVKMMKPFTNFDYLRQAFTEGEHWAVSERRLARAVREKLVTPAQAEGFRTNGALGSHLENLERNAGFKGFNQTGVSEIIAATDPRRAGKNYPPAVRDE